MKRIKVLDKYISELIAAGEVVERPSSVVKELVENSIDAGSSKITVEIKRGGISMIKISDNGIGIHRDDVRTAFLRHSTSKIQESSDLDSIKTLGFRGEALCSICAVSRVELFTAQKGEKWGVRYLIEAGEEKFFEETGLAVGTTFIVRDLFFNTPARMKFLKKDISEANSVADVVDRIALSHPEIAFSFIRDGKFAMHTQGDGKLLSCIYSIYGKNIADAMIPVEYKLNGVSLKGYVSRPEAARPSRTLQNFFVNHRFVKSKVASTALEEAFKGFVMVGKHPICVLYIDVLCEAVDVNVHPAKTEVRFINEKAVFEAVYYGVKSALMQDNKKKEMKLSIGNKMQLLVSSEKKDIKEEHIKDRLEKTAQSVLLEEKILKAPSIRKSTVSLDIDYSSEDENLGKNGENKNFSLSPDLNIETSNFNLKLNDFANAPAVSSATFCKIEAPFEKENKLQNETNKNDKTEALREALKPILEQKRENENQKETEGDVRTLYSQSSKEVRHISQRILGEIPKEKEHKTQNETNPENKNTYQNDKTENFREALKPVLEQKRENENQKEAEENVRTLYSQSPEEVRHIPQKILGEIFDCYILVQESDKLIFIDKHAAHERILYNELKKNAEKDGPNVDSQALLDPVSVSLDKTGYSALLENSDLTKKSGYEIEDFGSGTVIVRSAPVYLSISDIENAVIEIAEYLTKNKTNIDTQYLDWLYHNIACRAAIKAGKKSTMEEIKELIKTLEENPDVMYCPHGRPVYIELKKQYIEKQFGRNG